jgi:hypothetical protein
MSVQIGDKVLYLPHECHAFDKTPDNVCTWKFAKEDFDFRNKRNTQMSVSNEEAAAIVQQGANHRLIKIAPAIGWPAIVTKVNEDGSCDLEIHQICRLSNSILDYRNVKEDISCKQGHTWHSPNMNSPRVIGDWPKGDK